jgi:uncharacterized glyoxalase superfamily protein PhnB
MTWSAKLAPWPSVADAGRAVDFYKSAFGAVEPERLEGDVGVLQVARLGIGEADFWIQFDSTQAAVVPVRMKWLSVHRAGSPSTAGIRANSA